MAYLPGSDLDGEDDAEPQHSDADDDWAASGPARGDLPGDLADFAFGGHGGGGGGGGGELDALCEDLHGLPVEDAEMEVRSFLRRTRGDVSEADVLGVLLMVFRADRDATLEGYEPWDNSLGYCRRLTDICDANFVGNVNEEGRSTGSFPASIVGIVYAECGRTLFLAAELGPAREKLTKALNVFSLIPDGGDEAVKHQTASARSSLARVHRRCQRFQEALGQYLQALQLFVELDLRQALAGIITEWSETIVEAGPDDFSAAIPALLCELAVGAFGEGSDLHVQALKDIVEACVGVGQRWVAAEPLTVRARLLREEASGGSRGSRRPGVRQGPSAMLAAEAETAEEDAAEAWEEAVAQHLESRELELAAAAWAEALKLREALNGPESELVVAMRSSLDALRQAAAAQAAAAEGEEGASTTEPQQETETEPRSAEAADSWEDLEDAEGAGAPVPNDAW